MRGLVRVSPTSSAWAIMKRVRIEAQGQTSHEGCGFLCDEGREPKSPLFSKLRASSVAQDAPRAAVPSATALKGCLPLPRSGLDI